MLGFLHRYKRQMLYLVIAHICVCNHLLAQQQSDLREILHTCYSYEKTSEAFFREGRNAFIYDSKCFSKHWPKIDSVSDIDFTSKLFAVKYGYVILFPVPDLAFNSLNSVDKAFSVIEKIEIKTNASFIRFRATTLSRKRIAGFDYSKMDFYLTRHGVSWVVDKVIKKSAPFKRVNYWR